MKLLYSSSLTTHNRLGFQAQEMDDEIKGEGNSVNYKYRMHDPRLGRFFTVDPLFKDFPSNSSYAFSENNVIHAVELEGLEKVHVYNKWMDSKGDMQSKYSHTYIDKRLKENINQVNSYNAKGDIASKTYKSKNTSVKIKAGTEYKNDFTQFFDSEKSGFTSIDTRSMPDAMRHDSWEGPHNAPFIAGSANASIEINTPKAGIGISTSLYEASPSKVGLKSEVNNNSLFISTSPRAFEAKIEGNFDLSIANGNKNNKYSTEAEISINFGILSVSKYQNTNGESGYRISLGLSTTKTTNPIVGSIKTKKNK
jgi:RHS repeat-associated protein